jgi:colanic acid/amylovoran biosynthesis glycosyltransferase
MSESIGYLFERFPRFTQTFCAREVAELYRQGFRAPVYSLYRPKEAMPDIPGLEEIPVHYLPSTKNPLVIARAHVFSPEKQKVWSAGGDRRDKRRFREAVYLGPRLKRSGITHLHVHFASIAAHTAWWLKKLYGITYSFTGHAQDIFCPRPEHRVSLEELVRSAEFVVTVTDYSANRLKTAFPDASAKIFRVYNGLDLSAFRLANPGLDPLRIVGVGRLIEKKGWSFLVKACALLRAQGKHIECRIVGDGPDEEALRRLIRDRGLEDQVCLTGPLAQKEIAELLRQSSLFVLPAVRDRQGDSDNQPTVLVEALASGLPVVATNIAGIPEIVEQGKSGLLVPEKDASALASAIAQFASDSKSLNAFGKRARQIAKEKFQLETTVKQLRDLFATGRLQASPYGIRR